MDDLHWADPSTLRFLRHVTETVDRGRLVIVVTRRTHPVPSGALADYGETLARGHALRLELSGLTVDGIGQLVTATEHRPWTPVRPRRCGNAPAAIRSSCWNCCVPTGPGTSPTPSRRRSAT